MNISILFLTYLQIKIIGIISVWATGEAISVQVAPFGRNGCTLPPFLSACQKGLSHIAPFGGKVMPIMCMPKGAILMF